MSAMIAHLTAGGLLFVMADDPTTSRTTVEVEFFTHRVRFPALAAVLAERTGSQLAAGWVHGSPQTPAIELRQAVASDGLSGMARIADTTRAFAAVFEDVIRECPSAWHLPSSIFTDGA
jgi:lauroyl/myristoyl acyltransferase